MGEELNTLERLVSASNQFLQLMDKTDMVLGSLMTKEERDALRRSIPTAQNRAARDALGQALKQAQEILAPDKTQNNTFVRPKGHKCATSTTIADCLSFGSGELDNNGFWSEPCYECARAFEEQFPDSGPCWPFSKEHLEAMAAANEAVEKHL